MQIKNFFGMNNVNNSIKLWNKNLYISENINFTSLFG